MNQVNACPVSRLEANAIRLGSLRAGKFARYLVSLKDQKTNPSSSDLPQNSGGRVSFGPPFGGMGSTCTVTGGVGLLTVVLGCDWLALKQLRSRVSVKQLRSRASAIYSNDYVYRPNRR